MYGYPQPQAGDTSAQQEQTVNHPNAQFPASNPTSGVNPVQPAQPAQTTGQANGFLGAGGVPPTDATADRKRPFEGDSYSGREGKRQQSDRETVYRLLVPATRVGAVIGKQGSIVREIRAQTNSRIRVCEGVPNCDERVIVISARDSVKDDSNQAQRALLEVHRRVVEAEESVREQSGKSMNMVSRILVNHTQAGSIIGRAGCIIKDIRETTGAFCKILPPEEVPICGLHNDRVVLITGQPEQVKAAVITVSRQIRDNPPRERPGGPPTSLGILQGYTLYNAAGAPAMHAQYVYPTPVPNAYAMQPAYPSHPHHHPYHHPAGQVGVVYPQPPPVYYQ